MDVGGPVRIACAADIATPAVALRVVKCAEHAEAGEADTMCECIQSSVICGHGAAPPLPGDVCAPVHY